MADSKSEKRSFYVIFLILGFMLLLVLKPYISMFVLALVVTLIFDPIYQRLVRLSGGRKGISAMLSTLLVYLSFVIPLLIISAIALNQAIAFANSLQHYVASGALSVETLRDSYQNFMNRLPENVDWEKYLGNIKLEQMATNVGSNVANIISDFAFSFLQNGVKIITDLTIFTFVLYYLFIDRNRLFRKIIELSPLNDEDDEVLIRRFESMARSLLKGSLFIGMVQGTLGGLMFSFLGIPSSVFWAVMMGLFSLLPMGSGMIWTPAAIILIFLGQPVKGLILLAFGYIIISSVDNIIRGKLLSKEESHLHPLITLLSVLGGIKAFGFVGFLYGPLLAMLFLTAIQLYRERSLRVKKRTADAK